MSESSLNTAELFEAGNYAIAALKGSSDDWRTYAALGLIGKTQAALEGLSRFNNEEAYFYTAVTNWIGGDDEKAAHMLETIQTPHAQNLLNLIRKPQINVLAQLPWSRAGSWDLLTASAEDSKFDVSNISFHPEDQPNQPYADIHQFYDAQHPPDFYICQMAEWHLIPPNLQELPCPILGQTADYDLHIQAVYPWLQLFDHLLVTDQTEWADVNRLTQAPVATFPKSFAISANLPDLPEAPREFDLFLSGTVTHPYHPDKAEVLHQVLRIPSLKTKIVQGFEAQEAYCKNLASAKVCFTYIRHPAALPTRGLEALSMGCAVVVQKDNVLTLFVGEEQGVLTYDLTSETLAPAIQQIVRDWSTFEARAQRGAVIIRKEFAAPLVASQYLRFLTFLAAKPHPVRQIQPANRLVQKRMVLQKGWLPSYDFHHSPVLKRIGLYNDLRLKNLFAGAPNSSHLYIDLTREMVLFNYHQALHCQIPVEEWLELLTKTYQEGIAQFPRSLVLRFNFIRVALHFGDPALVKQAIALLEETLALPLDHWQVDVLEDVFPWDFCPQLFNYRAYFDLVTNHLMQGTPVESSLIQLILASLHYYKGFYASYQGYYTNNLNDFKQATVLDPSFPFYKLRYARQLVERGLPEDFAEATPLLLDLVNHSMLFQEAFELIKYLYNHKLLEIEDLEVFAAPVRRAKPIQCVEQFPDAPLQTDKELTPAELEKWRSRYHQSLVQAPISVKELRNLRNKLQKAEAKLSRTQAELNRCRSRIEAMETSKFWQLRKAWFRMKQVLRLSDPSEEEWLLLLREEQLLEEKEKLEASGKATGNSGTSQPSHETKALSNEKVKA